MFCMKCQHDLAECTCPDLVERMAKLSQSPNFALGPGSSVFNNPRTRAALSPEDLAKIDADREELEDAHTP